MKKTMASFRWVGFGSMLVLALLGVWIGASPTASAASPQVPAITARPTVQPLPTVLPTDVAPTPQLPPTAVPSNLKPPEPEGAHIVLTLPNNGQFAQMRAVVQWLGHDDRWYDVEGWQSVLTDKDTQIVWWVAPHDFGTGPFRWAVYPVDATAGVNAPLWVSASFQLPKHNGALVSVVLAQ